MDLKTLRGELQKLSALADGWDASHEIADIERDLALEKLRELYDAVRFGLDRRAEQPPVAEAEPAGLPPVEIDLDAVIGLGPVVEEGEVPPEYTAAVPPATESSVAGAPATPFTEASAEESVGMPTEIPAEASAAAEAGIPIGMPLETPLEIPSEVRTEPFVEDSAHAAVTEEPELPAEAVAAIASAVSELSEERESEEPAVTPVVAAEPAADAEPLSLFDLDPIDVKRAKHRVVLSLYGDTAPVESGHPASGKAAAGAVGRQPSAGTSVADSVAADTPVAEPVDVPADAPVVPIGQGATSSENGSAVLGETLNSDVKTLCDVIAQTAPTAAVGKEPVTDLRQALCNNDRFLLARDLFGGDMAACERTIARLNEFEDLDECMIYIAENFDWNPHSDGAKLLVDLIERKLA